MGMLFAKLPPAQFSHVRQAIDNRYMELLRQDGADGSDPGAVRTPAQRRADVIFELVTDRDSHTGEFLSRHAGVKAKASTQLVIIAEIGVIDGANPRGRCEIVGAGPVPPQILRTLSKDTELCGSLFDRSGRVLWLGRRQRLANAAQRLAIAIRDGGCFECGTPMHRCELHHVEEWHRDGGRTDIENLVAVCHPHHKWLETENLVVRRTADGWKALPRDGPLEPTA